MELLLDGAEMEHKGNLLGWYCSNTKQQLTGSSYVAGGRGGGGGGRLGEDQLAYASLTELVKQWLKTF